MWCIYKNGVCIMMQDTKKRDRRGLLKWVYIPEKKWLEMTDEEKARYIV